MNNAGIVDIWWSFGFTPVALFYGIFGSGHMIRNALISAMVFAWSFRLGMHLYKRVMSHHPEEDSRYTALSPDKAVVDAAYWSMARDWSVISWVMPHNCAASVVRITMVI